MSTTGFRWQRETLGQGLAELVADGVVARGLVLGPPDDLEAPLSVRPEAADPEDDWVHEIEDVLGAADGARIGVAAGDPVLAGALAAELAVRLGDRGQRVVLIDGSVEDPSIAKALPDDGDEGLVDIVTFGVSAVKGMRRTLASGVSLITAGSYPLSATDVFEADGFSQLLAAVSREAAVVLVLPGGHLRSAAPLLTSVVAVARSADDIRSLGADVSGTGVIGILAVAPESAATVEEVGATVKESAATVEESAATVEESAATVEESAAAVKEAAAETPEPAVGRPAERRVAEPGAVGEAEPPREPGAEAGEEEPRPRPSGWVEAGSGAVVTAARPRELVRRRSRRPLVVGTAVVAVVIVAGWLGVRAFRGAPWWPGRETGRPAGARVDEEPAREPPGLPVAGDEAPVTGAAVETAVPPGDGRTPEPVGEAGAERGSASDEGGVIGEPRDHAGPGEPPAGEIVGPGGPYVLFVTSHRVASEARAQAEALTRSGVTVGIFPTEVGEAGVWHRVAVSGGYPTLAAARAALDQVKRLGYEGAWIERDTESR